MRIAILSNEYPPNIYGGAGVHVSYLTRELAKLNRDNPVKVLCFGRQKERQDNLTIEGIEPDIQLPFQDNRHRKFMDTMLRDIMMAGSLSGADIVHCHTWYSHLAGCLLKPLLGARLVLTTHSLEPHRPWKVEQLGTAYNASTWVERTAYENADGVIAVSNAMRGDVHQLYGVPLENIRVIYNGVDQEEYKYSPNPSVLTAYKVDPDKPFVLFVGRITRQKGIIHLVNAIKYIRPGTQVVLCAGAPDTDAIGREMADKVEQARTESENDIIWISKILPKEELIAFYSQAAVFVCPSVYEPFGIINLEAMACNTPVVASAVGGIPEIVVNDKTGYLVPFTPISASDFEPRDPDKFARDLAAHINLILDDPAKMRALGAASRQRVEQYFSWTSIARQTLAFYQELTQA
ncbi:MAG: glycogen synthase [Candidatus Competibacteraceae bacterium]